MNKLMISLFVILLSVPIISGVREYRGIPVYSYHYDVDVDGWFEVFDGLDPSYWVGVRSIKLHHNRYVSYVGVRYCALYWYHTHKVEFSDKCSASMEDLVIHELAHHKNDMDGVDWGVSNKHGDIFWDAYYEIEGAMNYGR